MLPHAVPKQRRPSARQGFGELSGPLGQGDQIASRSKKRTVIYTIRTGNMEYAQALFAPSHPAAADMPSYCTKGRLPICPVTVLREDCQYAQLRYKRGDADTPSYDTKGGLPICPVTAHKDCSIYVHLRQTRTAADMFSHGSGHR